MPAQQSINDPNSNRICLTENMGPVMVDFATQVNFKLQDAFFMFYQPRQ
jgi:hypothetical protein